MGFGTMIFDKMSSKLNENGYHDHIHQCIWLKFSRVTPYDIWKSSYFIITAYIAPHSRVMGFGTNILIKNDMKIDFKLPPSPQTLMDLDDSEHGNFLGHL